jgi:hypothetical protein
MVGQVVRADVGEATLWRKHCLAPTPPTEEERQAQCGRQLDTSAGCVGSWRFEEQGGDTSAPCRRAYCYVRRL